MRIRPKSLVFIIVVLALGGFAYYDYKQAFSREETEKVKVLTGEYAQLERVQILNQKLSLLLNKRDQQWFMEKPVKDFADSVSISSWFRSVQLESIQPLEVTPPIKWEEYYLDKAPKVELSFKSGDKVTFHISRKPSFDGNYFLRKGEELFLISSKLGEEVIKKTGKDFRSLRIVNTFGHPSQLKYKGKEAFSFSWANYNWSMKGQDFPLSEARLIGFWTELSSMKAKKISHLKRISNPKIRIELKFKKQKISIDVSGVKEDGFFVKSSDRKFVLEFDKKLMEKLLLSENNLRDHEVPFKYRKEEAKSLEAQGRLRSYSLIKEKTWSDALESQEVDDKNVDIIFNRLSNLMGESYKQGQIKKPWQQVVIKDKNGENLFHIKIGKFFKNSKGEESAWVQTSLSKELVLISKVSLNAVFEISPYLSLPKKEKKK